MLLPGHPSTLTFLSKTVIILGLTYPQGMCSVFLLEDSASKYTPLYDEVKISSPSRLTKHKCQIKLHG